MNARLLIPLLVMLGILAMAAACTTAPDGTPTTTTTPPATAVPGTATQTPGASLSPGPTETLPGPKMVAFQIDKNPIPVTPVVTVTFNGGLGQADLTRIVIKFTSAEGRVEEKTLLKNQIRSGERVEFQGTTGTDRVEIRVSYTDGSTYKVVDQLVPFQTRR
ncbi:MAG: hypothetical protein QMD46_02200 [Methanomicrobiales archaeon]|nr:hypothetical protein [Methanomicrobiales archaeon]MDI6875252.1 hypothetical protein [Methanomicrobiales archaeon]